MKRTKLQRKRVIAVIAREVQRFVKQDEWRIIDDLLMHGVAWCRNTSHTTEEMGKALIALSSIAGVADLEHVADSCIWHRERLKGAKDDAPHKTARRTLAPLGVRYAACGCLAAYAGDSCCNVAAAARKAS